MPLKDHAKLHTTDQWSGFHSTWAIEIMGRLNTAVLSTRYKARPNIHLGIRAEIDVGTLEREEAGTLFAGVNGSHGADGGVATAPLIYSPPEAAISANVSLGDWPLFEIQVQGNRDGWRLVAAIELVSPSNKDRGESRRDFAVKCASLLAEGVSVVVVDVVTERQADLHMELAGLLGLATNLNWKSPTGLSAVCYRASREGPSSGLERGEEQTRLDLWPRVLTVGEDLPTVPLWLASDHAAPLELELSYTSACRLLRLG